MTDTINKMIPDQFSGSRLASGPALVFYVLFARIVLYLMAAKHFD
jgi:hypothetical protein